MSIVRGTDRVLIHGITGKQGTYWTERMQAYGTNVVGGVNPKKDGIIHCEVPVFASAKSAMEAIGFDVSVLFIPPLGVREAALDAIDAGSKNPCARRAAGDGGSKDCRRCRHRSQHGRFSNGW